MKTAERLPDDWSSDRAQVHELALHDRDRWRAGTAMVIWTSVSMAGWLVFAVLLLALT